MCGAALTDWAKVVRSLGLSPRVRGSQHGRNLLDLILGPIPACAGQPLIDFNADDLNGAYPRVCGAASAWSKDWCFVYGLSPRVRGSRFADVQGALLLGPIPACAGQPFEADDLDDFFGAYPRVCGAASTSLSVFQCLQGLSPRVRGSPTSEDLAYALIGPIPACAGQPPFGLIRTFAIGAYPRVCGAAYTRATFFRNRKGLSPRVRGSPHRFTLSPATVGPIPACAGQPRLLPRQLRQSRAYPRVCGAASSISRS